MLRIIKISIIIFLSFGYAQDKASIDFTIKNLGINVDGYFDGFEIKATLNAKLELIAISGKINVSSIKTGIESRDKHLLEAAYFDAKNYKQITLKSTSVSKTSETEYTVVANLTIKGKTRQITILVYLQKLNDEYKMTSAFKINRRNFNVGGGNFIMHKMVKIKVVHYQDIP